MVGPGWLELEGAVWSSPVVVPRIFGHHAAQVPFAEDQHPVGDLGPGGEHESFGVSIRARAPGRNPRCGDADAGQDPSKVSVNCPARSRTRNRKSSA